MKRHIETASFEELLILRDKKESDKDALFAKIGEIDRQLWILLSNDDEKKRIKDIDKTKIKLIKRLVECNEDLTDIDYALKTIDCKKFRVLA